MEPLVTIYLPTRGRPRLLERSVRSALAQEYPRIEVFVVVDGPCEESRNVLSQFSADQRLVVHQREAPGGAPRARNDAISRARGELITGLDDDDELITTHVANLVSCLERTGAAFTCTTNVLRRSTGDIVRHPFVGPVPLERLLMENVVGNQVLTHTESLRRLGGFDPEMPAWQDYELWIRLCQKLGSGHRIDARSYIQHIDHGAERISRPDRIFAAHARLVEKHGALLDSRQRCSLELLMYATSHQPYPLRRLGAYLRAGLGARALQALISDRFPAARAPLRRAQGWLRPRLFR